MLAEILLLSALQAPVDTDMATGRFVPDRMLSPEDIAEAVMFSMTSSSQCIPQDMTLRLALSAAIQQ